MTVDYEKYQDDPEFKEFQEAKEKRVKQAEVDNFIASNPLNKTLWEDGGLKEVYEKHDDLFSNQKTFDIAVDAAKFRLNSMKGQATPPAEQVTQTSTEEQDHIPPTQVSGGAAPAGPNTFSLHDKNVDTRFLKEKVKHEDGKTMSTGDAIFIQAMR